MVKANIKKPEIILRYAQAILAVAVGEGILDQVEEEMTLIKEVLKRNNSLLEFLKNPQVTPEEKQKVIMEIFGEKVSRIVLHHVTLIMGQRRGDLLINIIDGLFRLVAESRRKNIGKLTTAIPISEETEKRLERVLSGLMGKEVSLKNLVDPSILGGFILQIDEQIIDASIQCQLGRLREEISRGFPCYR